MIALRIFEITFPIFANYYKQEPSKVAAMVLFGNALSIFTIPLALFYALPNFG